MQTALVHTSSQDVVAFGEVINNVVYKEVKWRDMNSTVVQR